MGGKGSGRPRKFQLGEIAWYNGRRYVAIVDYKTTRTFREYRVVPLTTTLKRAGRAYWVRSGRLESTGMKSAGSVKTYLANTWLDKWFLENEEGGRGCTCQCCPHEAIPLSDFDLTGALP